MKRTHLLAVLVGLAAVGIFAADASAFYHPGTGRFMQRDPGPGAAVGQFIPRDHYADGMNLYQYVGSNPTSGLLDPSGTIIVTVAGLDQSPHSLKHIEEDAAVCIAYALKALGRNYLTEDTFQYHYSRIGYGKQHAMDLLRREYSAFLDRKMKDKCSLEQFVAIGHSDGATAIYLLIKEGAFNKEFSPAYLGIIDLVRKGFDSWKTLFEPGYVNKERSHAGHSSALRITKPQGTFVDNYYQSKGQPVLGWRGRYIHGAEENTELTDAVHYLFSDAIIYKERVVGDIASAAGRYYAKRVDKENRPKPWDQAASRRKYGEPYGRW